MSTAMAALGMAVIASPPASAATSAPVRVMCVGIQGDVAGYVSGAPKSSKEILDLAGSLVGLKALPPFPTTVTTDAPDKLAVNSGEREVTINYQILVPTEVAALLRDNLGVPSILARNATAGVQVSGPVTVSVSNVAGDTPLDLSNPASAINISMKVNLDTTQSGRVFFRPTPIKMDLQIGGAVGGGIATVGTVSLGCDVQGLIASTVVQVKGTPSTPAVIDGPTVAGGQTSTIDLLGRSDFVPDDGNPILPDSLRITKAAGGATIVGGALVQPTAIEGGTYVNEVELCAAPRLTADTPGISELQKLTFPGKYAVKPGLELFNPHPLGMRLSFNGEQTAEIPLTTLYGTGLEFFGQFQAPGARDIERALEALPSIAPGDIDVVREDDGSYSFTFAGKLAESDQPEIELSDWRTQLDYSAYEGILEAVRGLTGGGGSAASTTATLAAVVAATPDPSATDMTLDQLSAELQAGRISVEEFFAKFGSALKNSIIKALPINDILQTLEQLFPQPPKITTNRIGEKPIPGESTGPLCTNFIVQTVATPTEVVVAKSVRNAPACRVSGRTVKKRVAVRRKVRGKKRTTYRTVKVTRTVRKGGCPQALVVRGGKLTISNLPVRGSRLTVAPRRVTITVTARGSAGKVSKSFSVSKKTASASGVIDLPASLAGAKRVSVKVSGSRVAKQTRTVQPS
jgi:hypothetical protein